MRIETCLFDAPVMLPVLLESLGPHGISADVVVTDADSSEDLSWSDLGFSSAPGTHRISKSSATPPGAVRLPACAAAGPAFDASFVTPLSATPTSKRMVYVSGDAYREIHHDPVADLYVFGSPSQHTGSPGRQELLRVRDATRVLDLSAGPHVPWLAHLCPRAQVYCVGSENDVAPLRSSSTSGRMTFVKGHAYYPACISALAPRAPFDVIRDHDPERTLAQACFAAAEYPKLLVPSRGVFIAENVAPDWIPPLLMSLNSRVRPHARVRGTSVVLDLSLSRDAWIPYSPKKAFYEWLAAWADPEVIVVLGANDTCAYTSAVSAPKASVSYVVDPSVGFPPDVRAPNVSTDVLPGSKSAAVHFRRPIDVLYVVEPQSPRVYAAWESKVQIDGVVVWDWKTVTAVNDADAGGSLIAHLESPDIALKTSNSALFRAVLSTWSDFTLGPPAKAKY